MSRKTRKLAKELKVARSELDERVQCFICGRWLRVSSFFDVTVWYPDGTTEDLVACRRCYDAVDANGQLHILRRGDRAVVGLRS